MGRADADYWAILGLMVAAFIGLIAFVPLPHERYSHEVICLYPNGGFLKIPEEAVEYARIANGTTYVELHSGGEVVTTLQCTIGKKPRGEE